MDVAVELALASRDELGEGPWWDVGEQVLWRVDILGRAIHRWRPETGEQHSWTTPERVGCFVPAVSGHGGVAGLQNGLSWLDFGSGDLMPLMETNVAGEGLRFNDGKCDREGRLWLGTMDEANGQPVASLYCYVGDVPLIPQVGSVIVSNGLGWSPDGSQFYYTDSGVRTIWAFDVDPDGSLGERRVFTIDDECIPDGLTVDAEGGVWSAKWDGSRVVRYLPNGQVDAVIELPVRRPTSVMFGGPLLEDLYITSARTGLPDPEPEAGGVLVARPGVRGLPEVPFDP